MPSGVYPRTEYHREICRRGMSGKVPWNKGKKLHYKVWNKGLTGLPARHTKPHTEESKRKISKAKKGQKSYWEGKTMPEETKEKISKTLRKGKYIVCKVCHKKVYCSPSKIQKFCSQKCKGEYYSGERNHLWNGGASLKIPYKHYRNGKYINWRKEVFKRDDYTCQECGKKSGNGKTVKLEPHHIFSYTYFPSLRYERWNGDTLCVDCHRQLHRRKEVYYCKSK